MHTGNSHLNQKFPPAPAPHCQRCSTPMPLVKMLDQHASGQLVEVTCSVECPACKTRHLGKRRIKIKGRHMQFAGQDFDAVALESFGLSRQRLLILAAGVGAVALAIALWW